MPTVTTAGTGSDTLVLMISEDAYLGDARFTVSVGAMRALRLTATPKRWITATARPRDSMCIFWRKPIRAVLRLPIRKGMLIRRTAIQPHAILSIGVSSNRIMSAAAGTS